MVRNRRKQKSDRKAKSDSSSSSDSSDSEEGRSLKKGKKESSLRRVRMEALARERLHEARPKTEADKYGDETVNYRMFKAKFQSLARVKGINSEEPQKGLQKRLMVQRTRKQLSRTSGSN